MKLGLGWIPDPEKSPSEEPDWTADEALLALPAPPEKASASHLVPAILHQGSLGSCVTNAVAVAVRASQMKQAGVITPKLKLTDPPTSPLSGNEVLAPTNSAVASVPPLMSRLFTYFLARSTHGAQNVDSGTYIRAAFETLNKFGFCPEREWAYEDSVEPTARVFRVPSHKAFRAAHDQREPTEYRRITETSYARIDVIKRAIANEHLVVFGTVVSKKFQLGIITKEGLKPPIGEPIAGGHAMCIDGYDGDDFSIVNSWGAGWGHAGRCRFSSDYIAWDQTRDLWIVTKAPLWAPEVS